MEKNVKFKKYTRWHSYSKQEKILLPIFTVIFVLASIRIMLPIMLAVINAVKPLSEFDRSVTALPKAITFDNFKRVFEITYNNVTVIEMFLNSIVFVVTFLFATMAASICTAYILSKFKFLGRNALYAIAVASQLIPLFGTTGAAYVFCDKIGLIDNIWLLWITGANGFDYTFLIVFSYFENVDNSYMESAKLDGAGNFTIFLRIMVPMVMPSILIMGLGNVVTLWNDYSTALIFLPSTPTLSTGIYGIKGNCALYEGGIVNYFAIIVVAVIPITLIYCLAQRAINKISLEGGIKG